MTAALLMWTIYVANAFLWSGAVVAVLAAGLFVLGLCRAAKDSNGGPAINPEIKP